MRPRNLARNLASFLPKNLRFAHARRMIDLDLRVDPRLRFKLAETRDELESAFTILHDEYVRAGFMKPHPSGMRVTPYHALPSTSTLIALWEDRVIGTVSVVRDSALGFPLDKLFDTKPLRRYGARLAEVSALAIHKDFRQNRGAVLFPLTKYVIEYCRRFFGVDYMVIAVNPRHIEFYESIFGFELFDEPVKSYDFVEGAPAVGAYIGTRDFYKKLLSLYQTKEPRKNLFHYIMELKLDNFEFPDRRYFKVSDPIMTPELLDYFFNERTNLFQTLSERERSIIGSLYDAEQYISVLPPCLHPENHLHMRDEARFEVGCRGKVIASPTRQVRMTVKNVSRHGFLAYLEEPIRFGTEVAMKIAIADLEIADLSGWPTWTDENGLYGFRVRTATANWIEFIEHLSQDMQKEAQFVSQIPARA